MGLFVLTRAASFVARGRSGIGPHQDGFRKMAFHAEEYRCSYGVWCGCSHSARERNEVLEHRNADILIRGCDNTQVNIANRKLAKLRQFTLTCATTFVGVAT